MAGRGARHTLDNKSYQQKLKPVSVYYYHIKYVLTLINYIFWNITEQNMFLLPLSKYLGLGQSCST